MAFLLPRGGGRGPGHGLSLISITPFPRGVLPSATWAVAWVPTPVAASGHSLAACAKDDTEGILWVETRYLNHKFLALKPSVETLICTARGPSSLPAWIKLRRWLQLGSCLLEPSLVSVLSVLALGGVQPASPPDLLHAHWQMSTCAPPGTAAQPLPSPPAYIWPLLPSVHTEPAAAMKFQLCPFFSGLNPQYGL